MIDTQGGYYAADLDRLVLGVLPRFQPHARHVGGAVPAPAWPLALRDGVPNPAQAARGQCTFIRVYGPDPVEAEGLTEAARDSDMTDIPQRP